MQFKSYPDCAEYYSQFILLILILQGSVVINGMEEVAVRNREEVYNVLRRGADRRKTAATLLNMNSRYFHSIHSRFFTVLT